MSNYNIPQIVLLGSNGFVCTSLIRSILKSFIPEIKINALVKRSDNLPEHKSIKYFHGLLPDDLPDAIFPDIEHVVVHFATKLVDKDKTGFDINTSGIKSILSKKNDKTIGIIYGSSMSVYGQGSQIAVEESFPSSPNTSLAKNRAIVESIILNSMKDENKSAFILRPRFIFGQQDKYTLPSLVKMVKNNYFIGNGNQAFSIIDVDDYAKIIIKLTYSICNRFSKNIPYRTIFNIGYDQPLLYHELVDIICKKFGMNKPSMKIPANETLFKILKLLPFNYIKKKVTQLELIGLSHFGKVELLKNEIGNLEIDKSPVTVFENIVENYIKSSNVNEFSCGP